jgi:hypothetical protein
MFGVSTNHRQTRIHKTHHSLELWEATTFPLIIYFVPFHKAHIQMAFCLKSPKIPKVGTFATLGPYNFAWKPSIEMKSETKL